MKIQTFVNVLNKVFNNKKNTSVSMIYGDMYNTPMFKDFVSSLDLNSYEIIMSVYIIYFMSKDPSLSFIDAVKKATDSVYIIRNIEIRDVRPSDDECDECDGSGRVLCRHCDGYGNQECEYCDGTGEVSGDTCDECGGDGETTCTGCSGEGEETCYTCNGSGQVENDTNILVDYNLEYWVTSNEDAVRTMMGRDSNSYFDRSEFEDVLDDDMRSTLFLGYQLKQDTVDELIDNYQLDIDPEQLEFKDNYYLDINELILNNELIKNVGMNKFRRSY